MTRAGTLDSQREVVAMARAVGGPERWTNYFGHHARTFRFAARLLPPEAFWKVAGLYAFCRFTDDLVDEPPAGTPLEGIEARLTAWRGLVREAWDGGETEIPILDRVLAEARRAGVPRRYPEAILDGVAMDLERRRYRSWSELEAYTFAVAGAVGGWFAYLFGIRDPQLVRKAHALGHGMQLTNIVRDVGEDWRRGRLYLPRSLLDAHGADVEEAVQRARAGDPVPGAWRAAMEEVVARADAYYEEAWPGIAALPHSLRWAVAVASSAYRGIHREVRRNEYDNLRRRAWTRLGRKIAQGIRGVVRAEAQRLRGPRDQTEGEGRRDPGSAEDRPRGRS